MTTNLDRRNLLAGATAGIALLPLSAGHAAVRMAKLDCCSEIDPAFWGAFLAGVASGWVVEALKNYGLTPGAQAAVSSNVYNHHVTERANVAQLGYDTDRLYSGTYSGGAIAVNGGSRGNNYIAFNTSDHGRNTCSLRHYIPDIYAMNAVTRVLRSEGVPSYMVERVALPIHGQCVGTYDGLGHTSSRTAMTPNGGEISWIARHDGESPVVTAQLRSRDLTKDITARPNGTNWKYTTA